MEQTKSNWQVPTEIDQFSENKCYVVVIQPTPFCNINCRYCYLPDRLSNKRLSDATLYKIIKALFSENLLTDETDILWHASEPLSLPISYYKNAFAIIDSINRGRFPLRYIFQTNATLITDEWCEFISEHNIQIGVSIDGPQHIHDRARVDRSGRGTFDRAFRGIKLLQKHQIPFATISVITKYSLDYLDEIFDFFVSNEVDTIGFNFEEVSGANISSSIDDMSDFDRCRRFISRLLDLQINSSRPITIREFTHMSQTLMLNKSPLNTGVTTPFRILNFDVEGNFSTFCPELLTTSHPHYGSFTYGNIHAQPIRSLVNNPKFLKIYNEIQDGITACANTCEYFQVCGGGIPSNKVSEKGTFACSETMLCKLKIKTIADVIINELERVVPLTQSS